MCIGVGGAALLERLHALCVLGWFVLLYLGCMCG